MQRVLDQLAPMQRALDQLAPMEARLTEVMSCRYDDLTRRITDFCSTSVMRRARSS